MRIHDLTVGRDASSLRSAALESSARGSIGQGYKRPTGNKTAFATIPIGGGGASLCGALLVTTATTRLSSVCLPLLVSWRPKRNGTKLKRRGSRELGENPFMLQTVIRITAVTFALSIKRIKLFTKT